MEVNIAGAQFAAHNNIVNIAPQSTNSAPKARAIAVFPKVLGTSSQLSSPMTMSEEAAITQPAVAIPKWVR